VRNRLCAARGFWVVRAADGSPPHRHSDEFTSRPGTELRAQLLDRVTDRLPGATQGDANLLVGFPLSDERENDPLPVR